MRGVRAHVRTVVPAALALRRRRRGHDHFLCRFLRHFDNAGLRGDEDEFQVVAQGGQQLVLHRRGLDRQFRLQRGADGARGTQVFQLFCDVRAHGAQGRVFLQQVGRVRHFRQLPPGLREDGFIAGGICFRSGEDGPCFFGRERQGRSHQAQQALRDMPQGRLRRTARVRAQAGGVQTVLQNVQVEATQVFRAVRLQLRHHRVELVARVVVFDLLLQRCHVGQRIAVDLEHLRHRHGVRGRIEVRGVGQQEAQGVADAAVRFRHAFQDLVGDRQLARVVGRGDPQAQDVGAQGVRDLLRRQRVAQ